MRFTETQAATFKLLGFRTLKTKADYSSDDEYVSIRLQGGKLAVYTTRGEYDCPAFSLPAEASPATILAQFLSLRILENDANLRRACEKLLGWISPVRLKKYVWITAGGAYLFEAKDEDDAFRRVLASRLVAAAEDPANAAQEDVEDQIRWFNKDDQLHEIKEGGGLDIVYQGPIPEVE